MGRVGGGVGGEHWRKGGGRGVLAIGRGWGFFFGGGVRRWVGAPAAAFNTHNVDALNWWENV